MREMKDSGVPWIGKIPEAWTTVKTKYNVSIQNGSDPILEGDIPVYGSGKSIVKTCGEFKIGPATLLGRKGTLGSVRYIDVGEKYWNVDTAFNAVVISNDLEPAFYNFCSLIYDVKAYMTSTALPSMKQSDYMEMKIPFPSRSEQRSIVSYINDTCSKVEDAISRHQSIIEKLEEYKKSIITQAVTNGLNPDVEMKDSGIDYIGNYPLSWALIRIKYLLSERNTRSITGEEEPLSMSQVYGLIPTSQMDRVPLIAATNVGAKIAHKSDLVFNKLKAHLGVFAVSNYDGLVSPDYAVYTSKDNSNPKYLEYLFKTETYICEFKKRSTGVGAGLTRLYTSELFEIKCAIPALEEQQLIVDYLDKKCESIKNAISRQKAAIEKLDEYRKSLIYNAVTGKIDCREAAYEA